MTLKIEDYPDSLRGLIQEAIGRMDGLSTAVANGQRLSEWRTEMDELIVKYTRLAMQSGAGRDALSDAEIQAVERYAQIQKDFLDNFESDVVANGWMPAYTARARMYATSIAAAYHSGDVVRQAGKMIPLPAMPTEGSQCLTSCKCQWRIDNLGNNDFDAYWMVNSSETCQTCVERGQQWYPLRIRDGVLM